MLCLVVPWVASSQDHVDILSIAQLRIICCLVPFVSLLRISLVLSKRFCLYQLSADKELLSTSPNSGRLFCTAPRTHTRQYLEAMSIFASKAAFEELGLQQMAPSTALMYHDCYICENPLNVSTHTALTDAHHAAVRIGVCGHMLGKHCLEAWLHTGNTCPICKRMLFEGSSHSLTQSDINGVVRALRRWVDGERALLAIARLMGKQEFERAQQRRNYEQEAAAREARSQLDFLNDEDLYTSSGEESFDMDDEEEDKEEGDDSDFETEDEDVSIDGEDDDGDGVALDEDEEL